jgi:hypothetical protein
MQNWISQIVISNPGAKMAIRKRPFAFTEQGVAMLSSVLNSKRAVDVNIAMMRAFVRLRELRSTNKVLARRLDALENKYHETFQVVFQGATAPCQRFWPDSNGNAAIRATHKSLYLS